MVVITCDQVIRKREEGPPDRRLGWSLSEVCHIPGSSFMVHRVKLCESAVRRASFTPYLEGLSGVYTEAQKSHIAISFLFLMF